MTNTEFYNLMKRTFEEAEKIARAKGEDYTKGSADALANFKEGGEDIGISPMKVCWIFMNKHYQAITNYVKTGGQSESEPIDMRLKDLINYCVLMLGIIEEGRRPKNNGYDERYDHPGTRETKPQLPPDHLHHNHPNS